jgi:hypothetical protein
MAKIELEKNETHVEGQKCGDDCYHSYSAWLIHRAPDILWYDVQDIGLYQGNVYAVGRYRGKIVLYRGYYGSCSGCGGWGEGGEPEDQEAVLKSSTLVADEAEAMAVLLDPNSDWHDTYGDSPDFEKVRAAIHEVALSLEAPNA